jgi:gluconolactonase
MRNAPTLSTALACILVLAACAAPRTDGAPRADAALPAIDRSDPAMAALVPANARLEILADGFRWTEGPVWRRSGNYLLFTDIPNNTVQRWDEQRGLAVFLRPAGYIGSDPPGNELGVNGLVFDREDRLIMADHGNRQIARLDESNFTRTTLASHYQGRRLNSPNDLVIHSNGDIYFTDPPYGLRGLNQSPAKELDFNGVYRLRPNGEVTLLTRELTFPNGIAFSPDERTLYVANSDRQRPIWMAFDVQPDGSIANGRVFFDASALAAQGRPGLPDGMAVDREGNLFATGPGGVLILSPEGRHLGTIETGRPTANCTFGDDGSTLYITANTTLMRIRTNARGLGF